MRTRSFLTVCVIVLFCVTPLLGKQDEELRTFLLKALTMSANALDDSRVVLSIFQSCPRAPDPNLHLVYEFIRKGNMTRDWMLYLNKQAPDETMDLDRSPDSIEPRTRRVSISDGTHLLEYHSTAGTKDSETQVGRARLVLADNRTIPENRGDIQVAVGWLPEGVSPISTLQQEDCVVHTELVTMNGIPSYIVERPMKIARMDFTLKYWLAPDKSGLPVRMEVVDKEGNIFRSVQTEEFFQTGGIWFIKKFTEQDNLVPGIPNVPTLPKTTTYDVRRIQLHPSVDEASLFSTSVDRLPVGTLLVDAIAGLAYTVGEGPVSDETVQAIINKAIDEMNVDTSGTSNRGQSLFGRDGINSSHTEVMAQAPTGRKYIVLSLISIVVALSAVVIVLFRRKLRH